MSGRSRSPKAAPTSSLAVRRESRASRAADSDERWDQILKAAAEVFHRLGYANATLRDVAAEVGINRATLYYYASSKEELLIGLLDGPLRQMGRDLRSIQQLDVPPRDKIRAGIRYHMQALQDNYPELFIFLAERIWVENQATWDDEIRTYRNAWAEIVEEAVASGVIRSDVDPSLIRTSITGLCDSTHRWWDPGNVVSLVECSDVFADILLKGMAPD